MGEQHSFTFHFPDSPEEQLDLHLPKKGESADLDLENLDRKALEELYFQKIGRHRFTGRTDDEVREAVRNPEEEIDRLRAIDRIDDVWADLGPTGK